MTHLDDASSQPTELLNQTNLLHSYPKIKTETISRQLNRRPGGAGALADARSQV
jgi:hypothetical protein